MSRRRVLFAVRGLTACEACGSHGHRWQQCPDILPEQEGRATLAQIEAEMADYEQRFEDAEKNRAQRRRECEADGRGWEDWGDEETEEVARMAWDAYVDGAR